MPRRPRLVVTLGDPCGIGPELLVVGLHALNQWADILVVGPRAGLDLLEPSAAGARVRWRWTAPPEPAPWDDGTMEVHGFQTSTSGSFDPEASGLGGQALWIDPTPGIQAGHLVLGEALAEGGRAAVEAVRLGAQLVMGGHGDALVTLPLSKAAAHLAGYDIPGHTEFLQQLSGSPITRMAFVSPSLSVVLHTVHQSLRSVVEGLDRDAVAETLSFAADQFLRLTGRQDLKVALCALNPHAGENGAFGDEEVLLAEARTQAEASYLSFPNEGGTSPFSHVASPFSDLPLPVGWRIFPASLPEVEAPPVLVDSELVLPPSRRPVPTFFGPLPADSLFHRAARGDFDLVVALYHDQGLIPIKVLEPKRAVNLTLGLPFIRTSPDHGTAFGIAGKWAADPSNFLEASALAVRLAGRARLLPWRAEVEPERP